MSLYIQITTRCNMKCKHCGFACTKKGHDMSMETFQKAIFMARDHGTYITIGGGEPTLHPLFKDFVMHAVWELASNSVEAGFPAVALITNGSNTELSLNLAKLSQTGVIWASVSHDEYHDPIDPRVLSAFTPPASSNNIFGYSQAKIEQHDYRGIRDTSENLMPFGRGKKWVKSHQGSCFCDSLLIDPKGEIFPCGCKIKSIGNIHKVQGLNQVYFEGYCGKSEFLKEFEVKSI